MFKEITGKEALKRIADGEEVHFRSKTSMAWDVIRIVPAWNIAEFISPTTRYVFAIKTELMRIDFEVHIGVQTMPVDVSKFSGKRVRVTVEEIEL